MSEAHEILGDVVDDRAAYTSDPITNVRTGAVFMAEIEANPEIALDAELGRDLRELVILHVRDKAAAAGINSQDRVRFTLYGEQVTFQIVERMSNPANPLVEFKAKKIVSGIDT